MLVYWCSPEGRRGTQRHLVLPQALELRSSHSPALNEAVSVSRLLSSVLWRRSDQGMMLKNSEEACSVKRDAPTRKLQ